MAGTLVHTRDGLKPIEQIEAGDWVLSRPENGDEANPWADKVGWNRLDLLDGPERLSLLDGGTAHLLTEARAVYATPEADPGFVLRSRNADDGYLIDFRDGGVRYRTTVYNFEVDEFHTYFADMAGIWVHDAIPAAKAGSQAYG